jgi:hypothetical protein
VKLDPRSTGIAVVPDEEVNTPARFPSLFELARR